MPRSYGLTNVAPYPAAPAVGAAGDTYWNTTLKMLFISDGTAWQQVGGNADMIQLSNTGTVNLANNVPMPITTYSQGKIVDQGVTISYSAGIFTVSKAGAYRWNATVSWPSQSASNVRTCILVNGTRVDDGAGYITLIGRLLLQSVGGPVLLPANATVQLELNNFTAALAGVIAERFSIKAER